LNSELSSQDDSSDQKQGFWNQGTTLKVSGVSGNVVGLIVRNNMLLGDYALGFLDYPLDYGEIG